MHADRFGIALGAPFATVVLEIADELLLLGVDGDNRLALGQRRFHGGIEDGELRIPIGMI